MIEFKFNISAVKSGQNVNKSGNTLVDKVCKICGKHFKVEPYRGKGFYCSKECANEAKRVKHEPNVICAYCGKKFYKKPSQIAKNKVHCCSKECMGLYRKTAYLGTNNPNYNNRKEHIVEYNNGNKYYAVRVPNDHPFGYKGKGVGLFYKEHRYIVEQHYNLFDEKYFVVINGKHYLNPNVDIHHKNEITTDNRLENLIPLTRSEHTSLHNTNKTIIRDTKTGRITGVFKQGELLENHIASDNQQPSIDRNVDKGSTTNSRVLPDNAEDSNANTSALPNLFGDDIV